MLTGLLSLYQVCVHYHHLHSTSREMWYCEFSFQVPWKSHDQRKIISMNTAYPGSQFCHLYTFRFLWKSHDQRKIINMNTTYSGSNSVNFAICTQTGMTRSGLLHWLLFLMSSFQSVVVCKHGDEKPGNVSSCEWPHRLPGPTEAFRGGVLHPERQAVGFLLCKQLELQRLVRHDEKTPSVSFCQPALRSPPPPSLFTPKDNAISSPTYN